MKNAKALLFSALLSFTGAALADGCSSCPSCPSKAMVCGPEGCSIPGVEAEPTKAAKKTKPKMAPEAEQEVTEQAKAGELEAPAAESEMDAELDDKE